jgi:hypothetical protein
MKRSEIKQRIERSKYGTRGSATWRSFKETRYPSSKQADELHKRRLPLDIDPEIRPVVLKLNREGFRTYGSCAGHRDRGFIVFGKLKEEKQKKVKDTLKQNGLEQLRGSHLDKDGNYMVSYNPIGRNSNKYNPVDARNARARIKRLREKAQKEQGMR